MTNDDLSAAFTGTLAIIGGGNMARSLIGGLVARGLPPTRITVTDPVATQLDALSSQYGVDATTDNARAVRSADVVVCAVKPQDMRSVAVGIREALAQSQPLLISIAAGIRARDLQRWAGGTPVVRCMPNRPALHGCGITALYATADVPAGRRALAAHILSSVGATLWLQHEEDMDAVTAISGTGPAYFFLLIEMMEQTGVTLGLSPEVSHKLAVETAYGAGIMAHTATESAATLRQQVASRGGTTEAAMRHLESHDIRAIFAEAIAAAARRSAQLADELGD